MIHNHTQNTEFCQCEIFHGKQIFDLRIIDMFPNHNPTIKTQTQNYLFRPITIIKLSTTCTK